MEDLSKLDIAEILEKLEKGYDIIENNFFKEETDFIGMGDRLLEDNVLPSVDLPLTLTDYMESLKKE